MKKTLINHKALGGNAVDMTRDFSLKVPQRKTNKSMSPEQMITKAFTGSHQKLEKDVWSDVLKK